MIEAYRNRHALTLCILSLVQRRCGIRSMGFPCVTSFGINYEVFVPSSRVRRASAGLGSTTSTNEELPRQFCG